MKLIRFLKMIKEDLESETVRPLEERYFEALLADISSFKRTFSILLELKMALSLANWTNS